MHLTALISLVLTTVALAAPPLHHDTVQDLKVHFLNFSPLLLLYTSPPYLCGAHN